MNHKHPFHPITTSEPGTTSFAFNRIPSWETHLSSQEKNAFELVRYGLNVINSTLQVVFLSLRIIATYQIFWEQVASHDNRKNGGIPVLNKQFRSTISCDASRIHHLLSQIGG